MKEDGSRLLTGGKVKGKPVYSQIPKGWRIDRGALTAPCGYVIIINGESFFGGKRKIGIVKEEIIRRQKARRPE